MFICTQESIAIIDLITLAMSLGASNLTGLCSPHVFTPDGSMQVTRMPNGFSSLRNTSLNVDNADFDAAYAAKDESLAITWIEDIFMTRDADPPLS